MKEVRGFSLCHEELKTVSTLEIASYSTCPRPQPLDFLSVALNQAGLELSQIHLPLPSKSWDQRRTPPPNWYVLSEINSRTRFCFWNG